ncbi:ATP-binding cassette domain-containing protein [Edwardsiella hoshinae]|uniref:Type I secretion system ATP-binding protein PrsD n=1 Tax=Edwardsiella hoshinae TaxID=93378 RepID=A0A376DBI1_9GAMM|nr:ATP-binding cassette domain-containing protein [Edwardsiella hoshinae]QPR27647.1 ATP-binding cassette domain-containing protein [Edwardsiella hoshinae]STC86565.1 Type I secretion system ATP-binding protein PrsD [Edwardsiella hoshinae]
MLIDAIRIYCQKNGIQLSTRDKTLAADFFEHPHDYISDDYFNYKLHSFICRSHAELPEIFIVEEKGNDFLVYERIISDFCCLSQHKQQAPQSFIGKKIIILREQPKTLEAEALYATIKKRISGANLFFLPLVAFSLLLPFYSNLFNSRLVYSSSLTSVLYITIFFIFFALLEAFLKTSVYKTVVRATHDNSIKISKLLMYILTITSDDSAPSTTRAIELSSVSYWKAISSLMVDVALLLVFLICIVLLLGEYSIILFLYYLGFAIFCVYARFQSYESSLKSIAINNDRLIDSISLHNNRQQVRFTNFDTLRHAFYVKSLASEKLSHQLDLHNNRWAEILKLNTFISMVLMYIACYLAINTGSLSIATIIAVMIINSRLSAAMIASVNGCYSVKVNLHQIKASLTKLTQHIVLANANQLHLDKIEQLTLENITIEPHGHATLAGYNANFTRGNVVGVVGKVGVGKSTLLRAIIAQAALPHGAIRYNQVNIHNIDALTFQRQIAYYQPALQFFKGTLRFNFNLYGIHDTGRILAIIKYCCPAMTVDINILDDVDADALNFSAGERQKIIISMLLEKQPSLIILDEPTSFMSDDEGLDFLRHLIAQHHDAIFIIASHNADVNRIATTLINISNTGKHKKIFINTPRPTVPITVKPQGGLAE